MNNLNEYYKDKTDILRDLFDNDNIELGHDFLRVGNKEYPILDDVIILLDPEFYPDNVRKKLSVKTDSSDEQSPSEKNFAENIQFTFGAEWQRFSEIRPEYEKVFDEYFDLLDSEMLKGKRVCDLGCGTGRWSYFLARKTQVRELILVDFSEAVFVARKNLADVGNALFFMGDIMKLPFKKNFADLIFSLGVLHHLPINALDAVRMLKKYAPELLIYLYYNLDNRSYYQQMILKSVTVVRKVVSSIRNHTFREAFSLLAAAGIYAPLIWLGRLLNPFGLSHHIPLYSEHHYMNFRWWRLLAYDRFFTAIEQRFSRKQIMTLQDTFSEVTISPGPAYWHFICRR